jgi:beta-N-acetylhexosaminidase
MDDMTGIANACPTMRDDTALRLERALKSAGGNETASEQAALIAKRDSLLELAGGLA